MKTFIEPIGKLINEFTQLPGVGSKTAQRFAYRIINMSDEEAENFAILSLEENYGAAAYDGYGKKVGNISAIFSVFFIAVVALVVLTTMSRLIDEERPMIACFKTLGYGNGRILMKYILFSLVCCLLGGAVGFIVLSNLLTFLIYSAFDIMFTMPQAVLSFSPLLGIVSTLAMTAAVTAVTVWVTAGALREKLKQRRNA